MTIVAEAAEELVSLAGDEVTHYGQREDSSADGEDFWKVDEGHESAGTNIRMKVEDAPSDDRLMKMGITSDARLLCYTTPHYLDADDPTDVFTEGDSLSVYGSGFIIERIVYHRVAGDVYAIFLGCISDEG